MTRRLALGAIVVAWLFGFGMRAAWHANADDRPSTMYKGSRLLTTADAYFYASGVKNEVDGVLAANPRVPSNGTNLLVLLTSAVVKVLGVPVEIACTWMPTFLAPLIAIPLILLGLALGQLAWGFLASLVAVLGFSLWNRTIPGYFDTDMLSVAFILAVSSVIVCAFWRRRTRLGSLAGMMVVAAPYLHPGSEAVLAAFGLGVLGYVGVFTRRESYGYRIVLALFIALLPIHFGLRVLLIGAFELGLDRVRVHLSVLVTLLVAVLGLVAWKSSAMDLVLGLAGLQLGGVISNQGPYLGVAFPRPGDFVLELQNLDVAGLGARVAGHTALLVAGLVGYVLACWRFRPLLLLAPLLVLGVVLGLTSLRYTIFAVPIVALGNMWLVLLVARFVAPHVVRFLPWRLRAAELGVAASLSAVAITPAVVHAVTYPLETALSSADAFQLNALGKQVAPGDFLISWWDDAYAAWYYAGVTTLLDGTKSSLDTWVAAEIFFTSSQREAAALARLVAEERSKHPPLDDVIGYVVDGWRKRTGEVVADFVPALREGRVTLPTPTRRVFLYMPWRLLQRTPYIVPERTAKGLLPEAELGRQPFLATSSLGLDGSAPKPSDWRYDASLKAVLGPKGERVSVFKITDVDANRGRVRTRDTEVTPDGRVCVVNIHHANEVLYMDRELYDSVLSQLLVLGRPDPKLFELVSYMPGGAIYRVLP